MPNTVGNLSLALPKLNGMFSCSEKKKECTYSRDFHVEKENNGKGGLVHCTHRTKAIVKRRARAVLWLERSGDHQRERGGGER